jgi:hypothetical protein
VRACVVWEGADGGGVSEIARRGGGILERKRKSFALEKSFRSLRSQTALPYKKRTRQPGGKHAQKYCPGSSSRNAPSVCTYVPLVLARTVPDAFIAASPA